MARDKLDFKGPPETRDELIAARREILRAIKEEFQQEKSPKKRKENLKTFKQMCRDLEHDAIAGHVESPAGSGKFYWPYG